MGGDIVVSGWALNVIAGVHGHIIAGVASAAIATVGAEGVIVLSLRKRMGCTDQVIGQITIFSVGCDGRISEDFFGRVVLLEGLVMFEDDIADALVVRMKGENKRSAVGRFFGADLESLLSVEILGAVKSRVGDMVRISAILEISNHVMGCLFKGLLLTADTLGAKKLAVRDGFFASWWMAGIIAEEAVRVSVFVVNGGGDGVLMDGELEIQKGNRSVCNLVSETDSRVVGTDMVDKRVKIRAWSDEDPKDVIDVSSKEDRLGAVVVGKHILLDETHGETGDC